jgi:hypothetical protein
MSDADIIHALWAQHRYEAPLSRAEQLVFGSDAVRDPASGFVFEQGVNAPPREVQALLFQQRLDNLSFMEAYRRNEPHSVTAIPDIDDRIRKLREAKS